MTIKKLNQIKTLSDLQRANPTIYRKENGSVNVALTNCNSMTRNDLVDTMGSLVKKAILDNDATSLSAFRDLKNLINNSDKETKVKGFAAKFRRFFTHLFRTNRADRLDAMEGDLKKAFPEPSATDTSTSTSTSTESLAELTSSEEDAVDIDALERAAESGGSRAKLNLAYGYEQLGRLTEAFKIYEALTMELSTASKIAEVDQNLVNAQFEYARCFRNGIGVEKDLVAAYNIYMGLAMNLNEGTAKFQVAEMLENGEGCEKDLAMAAEWRRHADAGTLPEVEI